MLHQVLTEAAEPAEEVAALLRATSSTGLGTISGRESEPWLRELARRLLGS